MEIAPIAGIRAVALASPQRVAGGERLPFEIEDAARADDEGRSAQEEEGDRGLDEEAVLALEPEGDEDNWIERIERRSQIDLTA
jgi:hypothetical protein